MKQQSFASLTYQNKKITTKREKFLNEMEQVVPWERLVKLIEPHYKNKTKQKLEVKKTKKKNNSKGRKAMPIETMLRIYFLQQWYNLSDPAAEEALYDMESMRSFANIELCVNPIPDETTILNFRHLLEKHKLTHAIFNDINNYLIQKGIVVSKGTMVDATIVQAPSSTKNKDKSRDPEMKSTRKNNQFYFGMKIHIGTDVNSNVVHSATVTPANVADIVELPNLLRDDDMAVFADAGYTSDTYCRGARKLGIAWKVNDKRKPKKQMSSTQKKNNRKKSKVRARVEHVFRVIKNQFGYRKARYKGMEKNSNQVYALLGLSNLYMQRKKLMV